jgi:hypothetical protein
MAGVSMTAAPAVPAKRVARRAAEAAVVNKRIFFLSLPI